MLAVLLTFILSLLGFNTVESSIDTNINTGHHAFGVVAHDVEFLVSPSSELKITSEVEELDNDLIALIRKKSCSSCEKKEKRKFFGSKEDKPKVSKCAAKFPKLKKRPGTYKTSHKHSQKYTGKNTMRFSKKRGKHNIGVIRYSSKCKNGSCKRTSWM